ncbi:MAG: hypothetical protein EKK45_14550 [Curvibacter sp.]|jgi:hypothetical protein|nr:MAG: hypothetical protein EKK45_14550 [Curvibacter sp.]
MLRLNDRIRLTRRENEAFKEITNFDPGDIRTLADLDAYVAWCKAYYKGNSRDSFFLRSLIDDCYTACFKAA